MGEIVNLERSAWGRGGGLGLRDNHALQSVCILPSYEMYVETFPSWSTISAASLGHPAISCPRVSYPPYRFDHRPITPTVTLRRNTRLVCNLKECRAGWFWLVATFGIPFFLLYIFAFSCFVHPQDAETAVHPPRPSRVASSRSLGSGGYVYTTP
ncbi:hypothetical protein DFH11DRAFT_1128170 [Phellopilus nigrolimitatus]|nr:hypothetical protein DFH11DRAFT_1128170 [Phellopilus nigrolimitatus]